MAGMHGQGENVTRIVQLDRWRRERVFNNIVHFGSSAREEVTVYAYDARDSQSLWSVEAGKNVVSQQWARHWRKIPLKGRETRFPKVRKRLKQLKDVGKECEDWKYT